MLTKITRKNQITLPKAVLSQCTPAEYYEVSAEGGRIILTPVQITRIDQVWDKLEALGIQEHDLGAALHWARSTPEPPTPEPA